MPEWDRFSFKIGDNNSRELSTVRHIIHAPSACRVLDDGKLKSGLIYDDSRLNKYRLNVVWVSANTWHFGSIYGTVEFQFTWPNIVAGQNIYWVEAMNYKPIAYRFLLSKNKYSSAVVSPYDPEKDDGPLKLKDGKYYWNCEYTSEFMIEADLLLARCTGIDFVTHHQLYCRLDGNACEDRQHNPNPKRTGSKMLSFILARNVHAIDKHLKPPGSHGQITELDVAYEGLEEVFGGVEFSGTASSPADCENLTRGSIAQYSAGQADQAKKLLSMMISKNHFTEALTAIVRAHFDDPEWQPHNYF